MIKTLILIGLTIAASVIATIALIKVKSKQTILWIGYTIGMMATMIIIGMHDIPYIQNLEEKINILTLDYENFAVEDSLKQN